MSGPGSLRARWFGPSLTRRLIVSLLLAFVLVWAALLLLYWQRWAQGREARLQQTVNQVLAQLRPEHSAAEVALRLRSIDELSQQELQDAGQSTRAGFILRDRRLPDDAPPVYVAERLHELPGLSWQLSPGRCSMPGQDCLLRSRSNARWALHRISLPMSDRQIFAGIHQALLPLLLLAFPLILLPLWLAVTRGLAPLNRLSRELRQRRPEDLSPLPPALQQALRHRELQPLVQALQSLLGRLRGHLERERAFLDDAAHELRTPMAWISAQAHVLRRAEDADAREQAGRQLDAAVARASHLVEQLLALARMEAASAPVPQDLDLAEWLREQLLTFLPEAERSGIELSLDAPEHLPWRVEPQALASIVGNLIGNALRYAGRGAQLELQLLRDPAQPDVLELWVKDDGPGIPPEAQGRLFQRFQRGPEGSTPVEGAGLGLAIVQQASLRLGASLSLLSPRPELKPPRGCVFGVRLPMASRA